MEGENRQRTRDAWSTKKKDSAPRGSTGTRAETGQSGSHAGRGTFTSSVWAG